MIDLSGVASYDWDRQVFFNEIEVGEHDSVLGEYNDFSVVENVHFDGRLRYKKHSINYIAGVRL